MVARDVDMVLGCPGTGKTTHLLNRVEEALSDGIDPSRIAYLAFTRKAASEARERALARFTGLTDEDLPWFRTLHSASYTRLGLDREQVLNETRLREFGAQVGLTFDGYLTTEGQPLGQFPPSQLGNAYLRYTALAKARSVPLSTVYNASQDARFELWGLEQFARALEIFKSQRGLVGFEDMLDRDRLEPLPLDLAIIDEAQDLTPQQVRYARHLLQDATRVIISGDDDQAIYQWAGADAQWMTDIRAERSTLPRSYRLPRKVKELADSVIHRVGRRVDKVWSDRGAEGEVEHASSLSEIDLRRDGSWLVLARRQAQLDSLEQECRQQGVIYRRRSGRHSEWSNRSPAIRAVLAYEHARKGHSISLHEARLIHEHIDRPCGLLPLAGPVAWPKLGLPWLIELAPDWLQALNRVPPIEVEYIRAVKRNGGSLTAPGNIELSTIHGVKGGEADNVFLLTDIGQRPYRAALHDPDQELRVLYVGMTRARQRLILQKSHTRFHWTI